MERYEGLARLFKPDWEALVATIRRQGTPRRVHNIELFQDPEISDAIAGRFDLLKGLAASDPNYARKKRLAIQRFCGFDYITVSVDLEMPVFRQAVADTAALRRPAGRCFQDEHNGPIQSWADFDAYPWPDPAAPDVTRKLEWYQRHTPGDMCLIAQGGFGHLCEHLTWLMGTESFCYALYDQRDLVQAIADRLIEQDLMAMKRILEFDRVKITWASDDMGYKTGVLVAPDDLRAFVLAGHRKLAALSPAAGLADVQGVPHALANCLLVGAAQEIHIQHAEHGNLLSVRLLDLSHILDRVFEAVFAVNLHDVGELSHDLREIAAGVEVVGAAGGVGERGQLPMASEHEGA